MKLLLETSQENQQIMPLLARGRFVADVVGIIGSIDIVLGDTDR